MHMHMGLAVHIPQKYKVEMKALRQKCTLFLGYKIFEIFWKQEELDRLTDSPWHRRLELLVPS